MSKIGLAALGIAIALATQPAALAVAADAPKAESPKPEPVKSADVAKAEAARRKPLQRCDELPDKVQVECLQKARAGIVEARQKREASAKSEAKGAK